MRLSFRRIQTMTSLTITFLSTFVIEVFSLSGRSHFGENKALLTGLARPADAYLASNLYFCFLRVFTSIGVTHSLCY